MARIKGRDIYLENDDQIYFGDNQEAAMWYGADGELHLNHTISGVEPTSAYHLTTKHYVDDVILLTTGFPLYYIKSTVSLQVPDWGQYVIHETGYLEVAGTIEFGEGGMLIIQGV